METSVDDFSSMICHVIKELEIVNVRSKNKKHIHTDKFQPDRLLMTDFWMANTLLSLCNGSDDKTTRGANGQYQTRRKNPKVLAAKMTRMEADLRASEAKVCQLEAKPRKSEVKVEQLETDLKNSLELAMRVEEHEGDSSSEESEPKSKQTTYDAANKDLWEAARNGITSKIKSALEGGADLEYKRGIFEQTSLNVATHYEKWSVAKLLLESGADPNSADCDGETTLLKAAAAGHTEFAYALLDAGAKVDKADEDGETPLIASAKKGKVPSVKLLLERGADLGRRNRWGKSALDCARECHKENVVKFLKDWIEKSETNIQPCEIEEKG